jgi:hypothetical protein
VDEEQRGDEPVLAEMERTLSGEPLLGPRQAALVDAVVHRLATGCPMSQADQTAFCWCAKALGLLG